MRHFYLIGGPMGVGKSAVCRVLKRRLSNCVFLDGDWCWDMDPFQVTEETKTMVMSNIADVLNRFLACSAFEHVVFCWVMHRQEVIDDLLSRLNCTGWAVHQISLVCRMEVLRDRLERDIARRLREPDVLGRSATYLSLYQELSTARLDCSDLSIEETAERILAMERPDGICPCKGINTLL